MMKNVNLGLLFNSNGVAVNIKIDEHLITLHFYTINNNNPIITMFLDTNYLGKYTHPKYIQTKYPVANLHKYEYTYTPSREEIAKILTERDHLYLQYVQEKITAYMYSQLFKGQRGENLTPGEEGGPNGEEGAP